MIILATSGAGKSTLARTYPQFVDGDHIIGRIGGWPTTLRWWEVMPRPEKDALHRSHEQALLSAPENADRIILFNTDHHVWAPTSVAAVWEVPRDQLIGNMRTRFLAQEAAGRQSQPTDGEGTFRRQESLVRWAVRNNVPVLDRRALLALARVNELIQY